MSTPRRKSAMLAVSPGRGLFRWSVTTIRRHTRETPSSLAIHGIVARFIYVHSAKLRSPHQNGGGYGSTFGTLHPCPHLAHNPSFFLVADWAGTGSLLLLVGMGFGSAAALLHGSKKGTSPPSPDRRSLHSVAVRHPKTGHRVENPRRKLHLHALAGQRATPHASADDRLVSVDRVLDHGPLAVA